MNISTRLRLAVFIPALMALVVLIALGISSMSRERIQSDGDIVRVMRSSITEINHAVFSYLLYHEERPKAQFLAAHELLIQQMDSLKVNDPEQKLLVASIRDDNDAIHDLFQQLVSAVESGGTAGLEEYQITEDRLTGLLVVKTYEADTKASLLRSLIDESLTENTIRTIAAILLIFVFTVIPLTIVLVRTRRGIISSVANLNKGAAEIGSGNLNYLIVDNNQDEISDLARAFNRMTANLNDVTASRSQLIQEISERRRAEEKLIKSEANYRNSLDNSPLGIRISDKDRTIYANRALLNIYGYTNEEEFKSSPLEKRYTPQSYQQFLESQRKRALGAPPSDSFEVDIVRKDQSTRHLQVLRKEVLWEGENKTQMLYLDITDRKQAEELLKESEKKYHRLFETINEGFALHEIIVDAEGKPCDYRYLEINEAFERLTGMSADKTVGKTVKEVLPGIEPYWIETYGEVALTGKPARLENYAAPLGKWFETFAFSPAKNQFAVLFSDMTERKKTEEAIRELMTSIQVEKNKLSILIDSIPDEVWFADSNKNFTLINPAAVKMFGEINGKRSIAELAGSLEVLRPDGTPRPAEEAPPLLALKGVVVRNQDEVIRSPLNNELRFRQVSAAPVKDAQGNIIGSVSIVRDVTDKKLAEQIIARQNDLAMAIDRIFRESLACEDLEDLALFCLNTALKLTQSQMGFLAGIGPDGLLYDIAVSSIGWDRYMQDESGIGRKVRDVKTNGLLSKVLADGKSLVANNQDVHLESIETPAGHPGLKAFLGVPLIEKGNTIGILGLANREGGYRDTEQSTVEALAPAIIEALARKKAEDALHESEDSLKRAQEIAHLGSWELDLLHNKLTWSDEVYRIYGVAPQEFTVSYEAFLEAVHPEDRSAVDSAYKSSIDEGRDSYDIEHRIVRKTTGEIRYVHERSHHLRDENGKIVKSIGMVHDVTESKQAEDELKQRTAELEVSNKELESFSYSVSHDLRAPLRSMEGFSTALLEDYAGKLDDQGKQYLKYVKESSDLMSQLIDDLLKLSRVTRSDMNFDSVNLSETVQKITAELQKTQPLKNLELIIEPNVSAFGDRNLIRLALENLLANAWKFTSKTDSPQIEFGINTYNNKQAYFIRDNGVGFDMAYVDKLFKPFQRLHQAAEFEGTGIGLATVQRVIRRHGGKVWAEGKLGKGATFYFTLVS